MLQMSWGRVLFCICCSACLFLSVCLSVYLFLSLPPSPLHSLRWLCIMLQMSSGRVLLCLCHSDCLFLSVRLSFSLSLFLPPSLFLSWLCIMLQIYVLALDGSFYLSICLSLSFSLLRSFSLGCTSCCRSMSWGRGLFCRCRSDCLFFSVRLSFSLSLFLPPSLFLSWLCIMLQIYVLRLEGFFVTLIVSFICPSVFLSLHSFTLSLLVVRHAADLWLCLEVEGFSVFITLIVSF